MRRAKSKVRQMLRDKVMTKYLNKMRDWTKDQIESYLQDAADKSTEAMAKQMNSASEEYAHAMPIPTRLLPHPGNSRNALSDWHSLHVLLL